MGRPVPHIPSRPLLPGLDEVVRRLVMSTQHPGGWVGVLGAWKKTPRVVSMVEREWGSLRSARESIEEASSSYSQGPDRGDS